LWWRTARGCADGYVHLPDLGSTPELSQRYGVVVFRGLGLEPPGSRPPCSERPAPEHGRSSLFLILWDGPAWMVEHALLLRRYRHLFPDEAGRGGSRVRPARAGRVARGSQAVVDGYLAIPCEPRLGMPVASVAS
jgi:hypothetical protein